MQIKKGGLTQVGNKELFQTYSKEVYRTCYYMVHDAADAEDLCQEVFITIFRSQWQEIDYLKAWIMKITVNTCLNHLKRQQSLQQKLLANLYMFKASPQASVEKLVEQQETKLEWAGYMSRLPVKIRAVLTLRYMHDFSLAEVADALSIPIGTVKSRLHKGLRSMKEMLREPGLPEELRKGEIYEQSGRCAETAVK
ncbi:RNA polymerase sigma factor [Paenibacillus sp. MMS20-IR301]|nr:RNA polymerase sigma factor [Paenibacillus sp. MMS20-IR301]WNS47115.1 RNA polymerase sigma factor [Paenibacillus sp. MMS20-IR301]